MLRVGRPFIGMWHHVVKGRGPQKRIAIPLCGTPSHLTLQGAYCEEVRNSSSRSDLGCGSVALAIDDQEQAVL